MDILICVNMIFLIIANRTGGFYFQQIKLKLKASYDGRQSMNMEKIRMTKTSKHTSTKYEISGLVVADQTLTNTARLTTT